LDLVSFGASKFLNVRQLLQLLKVCSSLQVLELANLECIMIINIFLTATVVETMKPDDSIYNLEPTVSCTKLVSFKVSCDKKRKDNEIFAKIFQCNQFLLLEYLELMIEMDPAGSIALLNNILAQPCTSLKYLDLYGYFRTNHFREMARYSYLKHWQLKSADKYGILTLRGSLSLLKSILIVKNFCHYLWKFSKYRQRV
jgi:hypothetical protein